MSTITIATFNCENLFRRFKFNENISATKLETSIKDGFIMDKSILSTITQTERKLTADAIRATKADIVCLQEVENMDTLKNFLSTHMASAGYKYRMLIDAKDPRFIDVALISKIPFGHVKTHQFSETGKVFSRDCLEVEFDINGKTLTVFVNHFKSMFDRSNKTPAQKRALTAPKRIAQCNAVLDIIKQKFKNTPQKDNWIVVGDLNDYPDGSSSLKTFFESPWMENIVETKIADPNERWTHFWDTTSVPIEERYKQIDYIFLSKKLATDNPTAVPVIVRKGISIRATRYTGPRFPDVTDQQEASDHCPVAVTINI